MEATPTPAPVLTKDDLAVIVFECVEISSRKLTEFMREQKVPALTDLQRRAVEVALLNSNIATFEAVATSGCNHSEGDGLKDFVDARIKARLSQAGIGNN